MTSDLGKETKLWDHKNFETIFKLENDLSKSLQFDGVNYNKFVQGTAKGVFYSIDIEGKKSISKYECADDNFKYNSISSIQLLTRDVYLFG